jgi:hypothetical protein
MIFVSVNRIFRKMSNATEPCKVTCIRILKEKFCSLSTAVGGVTFIPSKINNDGKVYRSECPPFVGASDILKRTAFDYGLLT